MTEDNDDWLFKPVLEKYDCLEAYPEIVKILEFYYGRLDLKECEIRKSLSTEIIMCLRSALLDARRGKCALEDRINIIIKSLEEYEENK